MKFEWECAGRTEWKEKTWKMGDWKSLREVGRGNTVRNVGTSMFACKYALASVHSLVLD